MNIHLFILSLPQQSFHNRKYKKKYRKLFLTIASSRMPKMPNKTPSKSKVKEKYKTALQLKSSSKPQPIKEQLSKSQQDFRRQQKQYKQFFASESSNIQSQHYQRINEMNDLVLRDVLIDIENNHLAVAETQKAFKLQKKQNANVQSGLGLEGSKQKQQLNQILFKKQQIQRELKKIQHDEVKYSLDQSRLVQSGVYKISNKIHNRMFKSQLTEEQKDKIKKALKQQKKFIKKLKQKSKKYQDDILQGINETKQLQLKLKNQKCQERKILIEKQQKSLEKRQQQRALLLKQGQQRLQQIKKEKRLYLQLKKSEQKKRQAQQSLKKAQAMKLYQMKRFNLEKINKHDKNYVQLSQQRQQERIRQLQSFQSYVKLNLPNINEKRTKFHQILQKQEKEKLEEKQQKQRKRLQNVAKTKQYALKIKQYYRPKTLMRLDETKVSEKQQEKPASHLLLSQIRNIGNNYMRKAFQKQSALLKHRKSTSSTSYAKIPQPIQQDKPQRPSHKNYLIELRQKRKPTEIKNSLTNEVSRIMKNQNFSHEQKLQRAKIVARRLQVAQKKENHFNTQELVNSISEKMKILQILAKDKQEKAQQMLKPNKLI